MTARRRLGLAAVALLHACGGATRVVTAPDARDSLRADEGVLVGDPGALDSLRADSGAPAGPRAAAAHAMPPALAFRSGFMPRFATRADAFVWERPEADGRGVLIAILDSGIDPEAEGLQSTTTGEPKLLDLRDFSAEGRLALAPATIVGDSVRIGDGWLRGARAFGAPGARPLFAGTLAERPLGAPPAADLNGDGDADDRLPLLVVVHEGAWAVVADTDGDGSLAGERPVRDYLVARETLAWRGDGRPAPIALAVNVTETTTGPVIDLLFDTSGHGTHVAGIAAGHRLFGVPDFDGVAPGAQLLGLKISDNAQGGISTTGAMVRALDYAIRFAAARGMPLVVNMSFGVGNEIEGSAHIDRLLDSVLARHPEVVFTTSAGNDGPGLSTIGFPASAERLIAVGALMPGVFAGEAQGEREPEDRIASFSARGGELAAPAFVTPGVAFSAVPRWKIGNEQEGGTSMAAPHAAGLVALLRSASRAEGRSLPAALVRQALIATARPLPGETPLDQGAGVPDVRAALAWLRRHAATPVVRVEAGASGQDAVLRAAAGDDAVRVRLRRRDAAEGVRLAFRSTVPWLVAPPPATVGGDGTAVVVSLRRPPAAPGVHVGAVEVRSAADTALGPLARILVTLAVPHAGSVRLPAAKVEAGRRLRVPFRVEAGRAVRVLAWTTDGTYVQAALHEPGGMPFRESAQRPGGSEEQPALYEVSAGEAAGGVWELVVEPAGPQGSTVAVAVEHAPVAFDARRDGASVQVSLRGLTGTLVLAEPLILLGGTERRARVTGRGSERPELPLVLPAWARSVVIDATMPREQWGRFTDLGMSLFDAEGRRIGGTPLNYAHGRAEKAIEPAERGQPAVLRWFPGLASEADTLPWTLDVRLRFFADSIVPLARPSDRPLEVEAGGTRIVRAPWREAPWPRGPDERLLGVVLVRTGETIWIRETDFGEGR